MKVSPSLILCHNLTSFGRALLAISGAGVIWLLQSLFLWVIFSLILGWDELTLKVKLACGGLPLLWISMKLWKMQWGNESWKDSLPQYEAASSIGGARLLERGLDLSSSEGGAIMELATDSAPKMVRSAWDEFVGMFWPTRSESMRLEEVRMNLAARDCWEFLRDFQNRDSDIRKLSSLGLVTVREIAGIWSLRISIKGQGDKKIGVPRRRRADFKKP